MLLSSIAPAHYRTTTALHAAVEAPMDTEVAGPASPTATQLLHTTNVSGSGPEALPSPRHLLLERLAILEGSPEKQALAQALSHLPMSALVETHPDFLTCMPTLIALLFQKPHGEYPKIILENLEKFPLSLSVSQLGAACFVLSAGRATAPADLPEFGPDRVIEAAAPDAQSEHGVGIDAQSSNDARSLKARNPADWQELISPDSYSLHDLLTKDPQADETMASALQTVNLAKQLGLSMESGMEYFGGIANHLLDYYRFLENPTPALQGHDILLYLEGEIPPAWVTSAVVPQLEQVRNTESPNGARLQLTGSGLPSVTLEMVPELLTDSKLVTDSGSPHATLDMELGDYRPNKLFNELLLASADPESVFSRESKALTGEDVDSYFKSLDLPGRKTSVLNQPTPSLMDID
jgi:hypothetical protein